VLPVSLEVRIAQSLYERLCAAPNYNANSFHDHTQPLFTLPFPFPAVESDLLPTERFAFFRPAGTHLRHFHYFARSIFQQIWDQFQNSDAAKFRISGTLGYGKVSSALACVLENQV
jgi:hypothetical protein